jgi:hypothetical protein
MPSVRQYALGQAERSARSSLNAPAQGEARFNPNKARPLRLPRSQGELPYRGIISVPFETVEWAAVKKEWLHHWCPSSLGRYASATCRPARVSMRSATVSKTLCGFTTQSCARLSSLMPNRLSVGGENSVQLTPRFGAALRAVCFR